MREMSDSERVPSIWSLPWRTVRLAGRCFLPLLCWFSFGELVRFGLLVAGTELSHGSWPQLRYALTMLVFVIMVMISLVVMIGMFHSLRGGLTEMRRRRAEGEADEGFLSALTRAIIPYVALYLSWGWHTDDAREFINTDIARQSGEKGFLGAWADFETGARQDTALGLIGLNVTIAFAIMAVAFVLRFFLTLWYERRGNRGAALGAAFCELAFFYYGIEVLLIQSQWVGERVITTWWNDAWTWVEERLPGWRPTTELIGEIQPFVWDALVLSAAWLTVAILVYGAYAEDVRSVIKGTRLETGAHRAERAINRRTHSLTRQGLVRFVGRYAHWVAIGNTVRLAVRGGAPLFGLFAVCFAAIQVADGYLWRGLIYLFDDTYPLLFWNVVIAPLSIVQEFVITALTVCLLAATFDLAATRGRAQAASAAREETPAPEPDGPAARAATAAPATLPAP